MAVPAWLNENRNRSYPFVHPMWDARRELIARLPDDVIVDAGFTMGLESGFDARSHRVYLNKMWLAGSQIHFEFASTGISTMLLFTFDLDSPKYTTRYADSGMATECGPVRWSGFVTIGSLQGLFLPAVLEADDNEAIIEPALIQNLSDSFVNDMNFANADRTRAGLPDACRDPSQTSTVNDVIFVGSRCVKGDIRFVEGYNCRVVQNDDDNSITIQAIVGSGAGEPCREVPLYAGEASIGPLSGGLWCNDTLRSINGISGPVINFISGTGVSIVPNPEENRLTVNVDMFGLSTCYDGTKVNQDG